MPPQVETHLVNTVLTNGARFYVDHAHPEFSTPECRDALECLRYDRAGELILTRSMEAADLAVHDGSQLVIYKNNSDGKGNSYGAHENYLMDRAAPFTRIVAGITPHFVTRQIFAGAGKVGCGDADPRRAAGRLPALAAGRVLRGAGGTGDDPQAPDRQHPGRAPRRSAPVPAAARHRGRRQPGRGGHLLEGGHHLAGAGHDRGRRVRRPRAWPWPTRCGPCTRWPWTATFTAPLPMADGSTATALDIQWELFSLARKYADDRGLECLGDEDDRRGGARAGGRRSSTAWRPTRCRWPASSTGWPSSS